MHGITEPWEYIVYCGFDQNMTKELFDKIVIALEDAGVSVNAFTCDQGGANDGFVRNKLGISVDKSWYQNPKYPNDTTKKIFGLFDYVHVSKNWRNNLVDHDLTVEDELGPLTFSPRQHFEELAAFCRAHEISLGYFLTLFLTRLKSSDRQDVGAMRKLLNRIVAYLFRRYFPNDRAKLALARICEIADDGIS